MADNRYNSYKGIDFSEFEPVNRSYERNAARKIDRQTKPQRKAAERPKLEVVKKPVKSVSQAKSEMRYTARQSAKIIAVSVVLLTMLAALLYGRLKVDNLDREISSINAEISAAQSENVRLNMQLDSMISLENVEDYARNKLGMVKMENYQIEYIDLSGQDKVVLSGTKALNTQSKSFFAKLLEYISK